MQKLNDLLPKELGDLIYSLEFEEQGGFRITKIEFNSLFVVYFDVYVGNIEDVVSKWSLSLSDYFDFNIEYEWSEEFEFHEHHPLLLDYIEDKVDLYFSSKANDINSLVADIYKAHHDTTKGWIEVEKYLNMNNLVAACSARFGLFASGPVSVIQKYKEVLDTHGVINNLSVYSSPKFSIKGEEGWKVLQIPQGLKLLMIGESYFISTKFKFEKIQ